MASYSETTAIRIRHGNKSENDNFTGLSAEVVADLGEDNTGTDQNTTLRLHNSINQGGIKLARADMANVTTETLAKNRRLLGDKNLAYADMTNVNTVDLATKADELDGHEGKNLAYADLSNLKDNKLDPNTQEEIIDDVVEVLNDYGLATKVDLNTEITALDNKKAEKDLSNVDTADLASGEGEQGKHAGKNLAYADMSNVSTVDLATSTGHAGTNLMYVSASNINTAGWNKLSTKLQNIDDRQNDISSSAQITDRTKAYPTVKAVTDYVDTAVTQEGLLKIDFKNAKTWDPLVDRSNIEFRFSTDVENIIAAGTGFTTMMTSISGTSYQVPTLAPTNLTVGNTPIKLAVYEINDEHKPISWRLYPEYGKTNISTQTIKFKTSLGKTLEGTIKSIAHPSASGVYRYIFTISDRTKIQESPEWIGTRVANDFEYVPLYDCTTAINVNQSVCIQINNVDSNGAITSYSIVPSTSTTAIASNNRPVYHPILITEAVQSGNNGTIAIFSENCMPNIGGAGLLKDDFSNLSGNSAVDKASAKDAIWNINREKPMPDISLTTIDESEYYRICTIGQVWDALHDYGSTKVTIRDW